MNLGNNSKAPGQPTATATTPPKAAAAKYVESNESGQPKHLPKGPRKIIGVSCTLAEFELILAGAKTTGYKPGPFLVACALEKNTDLLRGRDLFLEKKLEDILAELHAPKNKA